MITKSSKLSLRVATLIFIVLGVVGALAFEGSALWVELNDNFGKWLLYKWTFIYVCLLISSVSYAKSKGYGFVVCLIGLLPVVSLFVIHLLPDKWNDLDKPPPPATNYPRPPSTT